ncbi:MAG: histidinol-phosphatase [Bacillota bacterium]
MYFVDYHTHPLSHLEKEVKPYHNIKLLKSFIKQAKKNKIKEIGFSDHNEFIEDFNWDNLHYIKNNSDIDIRLGIEIDYKKSEEEKIMKLVSKYNFDYVIGSVHKINDWPIDHPDYKEEYKNWDLEALYKKYFEIIIKMVESNLFDIIGHIDLIKIFNNKIDINKYENQFNKLLKKIKEHDIVVEINTNGLNKEVNEIYPSYNLLKIIVNNDIPVTFGSDAHRPQRVGENIELVYNNLKKLGCNKLSTFKNRVRRDIDVF